MTDTIIYISKVADINTIEILRSYKKMKVLQETDDKYIVDTKTNGTYVVKKKDMNIPYCTSKSVDQIAHHIYCIPENSDEMSGELNRAIKKSFDHLKVKINSLRALIYKI